eukprot:g41599.t1
MSNIFPVHVFVDLRPGLVAAGLGIEVSGEADIYDCDDAFGTLETADLQLAASGVESTSPWNFCCISSQYAEVSAKRLFNSTGRSKRSLQGSDYLSHSRCCVTPEVPREVLQGRCDQLQAAKKSKAGQAGVDGNSNVTAAGIKVDRDDSNTGDKDALRSETGLFDASKDADADCAAFLESEVVQAYLQEQGSEKHPGDLQGFVKERPLWVGQFMACPKLDFDLAFFTPKTQLAAILLQSDTVLRDGLIDDSGWDEQQGEEASALFCRQQALNEMCVSGKFLTHLSWPGSRASLCKKASPPAAAGRSSATSASQPAGSSPAQAKRSVQDMMDLLGEEEDATTTVPEDALRGVWR